MFGDDIDTSIKMVPVDRRCEAYHSGRGCGRCLSSMRIFFFENEVTLTSKRLDISRNVAGCHLQT